MIQLSIELIQLDIQLIQLTIELIQLEIQLIQLKIQLTIELIQLEIQLIQLTIELIQLDIQLIQLTIELIQLEIQLIHLVMPHAIGELAHADPLDIHREHASLGEVNASFLFVGSHHACARVAVDVEHNGNLVGEFRWLIQERGNPPAREALKAQFLDAITRQVLNGVQPFNL